ncbi:MAG: chromosome segregation protein SMC [Sedimentisphaeraceae bacterium JB056]
MRLEKIILNGFKSFADKTEFIFDENITAIVGPNGCGKSNVVDAVKWVLGEQSKKSLRSSQMTDVIFSGSSTRKPSGMSEVSMIFSGVNSGDEGNDELQITRRLYRNGDSAYLINNKTARLKDIREQFMDTGVGVSAYSIIEQGQIAQLLTASKAERRVIFEEAAGISKYKAHKKDASRKLEKTEQRMLRVADVFNELQKQLRSVRLQAGKARNYVEYKERLDKLRMNYSLAEYDELTKRGKMRKEHLDALNNRFSQIVAEIARKDTESSTLRDTIMSQENIINENDRRLISVKSKIEQQNDRIEYLQKRSEELRQRKTTAADRIHFLDQQKAKLEGEIEGCKFRLKENEKISEEKSNQLSELQEMMHTVNMDCTELTAQLEEEKSSILETVRKSAQLKNEIESIANYRNNLTAQYDRAKEKAAAIEKQLETVSVDKQTYQQKLDQLLERIEHLQEALDAKREMMDQISEQLLERSNILASLKQDKSAVERELKLLIDMENKHEGVGKAVKEVLELRNNDPQKLDSIECLLAEIIETDIKYATALETVLEEKADWLIVNNSDKFLEQCSSFAENGRINALSIDELKASKIQDVSEQPGISSSLCDVIKTDEKYKPLMRQLLGNTFIAENIQTALNASRQLGENCNFVTLDGELVQGGYIIKIGSAGKGVGLISRKSRMNELEAELVSIDDQIESIQSQIDDATIQNDELTAQSKELRETIYEANTEKVDAQTKLQVVTQSIDNLEKDLPAAKEEAENVEKQIDASYERQKQLREQLNEIEAAGSQRTERIEELQFMLDEKRSMHNELSSQLTELRIAIGQTTVRRNAITQEINSLKAQIERAKIALQSSMSDLHGNDEQVSQTQRNILNIEAMISELYVDKEQAQIKASELRKQVAELIEDQQNAEEVLRDRRHEQSELEKQIHEIDLELNEIRIKSEDLIQRVGEELELDLEKEYETYEHETDIDWDDVKREINDLRGRITRLGNVNVDAIDELKELEEREKFLSEQIEDLNNSKTQLQQLINKINKESREMFKTTFDEVRENFKEIFRKLFGGGKADVMLDVESGEDILECGIEIIAQPPGKGAKSISLLSGGEKTMTAIALQFAIFKSKPSPFCFLDEVDAALDEANNERFNLIVKEFEKYSQFIVITHAKRTMSIADKLFGVTMQQQGVSKRIMVKFDQTQETDTFTPIGELVK